MAPPVAARQRLDSLTGLRAIAALAVFLLHIGNRATGDLKTVTDHVAQGRMGVTFFFLLSGFVLTWSHGAHVTATTFWRRRFARIYPAYFVALIGGLLVSIAAGIDQIVGPFIANLTLTQSWIPDINYYFGINGVNWSLADEAFFYLCFPLVVPLLTRQTLRSRRASQIGLVAAIFGLTAVAASTGVGGHASWFLEQLPPVRFLEFVLGCTAALDVRDGRWQRVPLAPVATFVIAYWLLSGFWATPFTDTALPAAPFFFLIVAAAWQDIDGTGSGFLRTRGMVWGGTISYCFYLVHQLVIRALAVLGDTSSTPRFVIIFIAALAISVAAAHLLHALVERPFERRFAGRRREPVLLP